MRRSLFILIILILSIYSSGCTSSVESLTFTFDSKGNYTGFSEIKSGYSIEQAEKDGCYVFSDLEPVAGQDKWDSFVTDAADGEDSGIRIMSMYDVNSDEPLGPYFLDLFYKDGYYHLFDSSSSDQRDKPYQYMLTLHGSLPNAVKDTTVTVLTDDKNLNFDQVMWSMLSSDMEFKKSISPFSIVMFH